jgi:hypothetical protein
MKNAMHELFRIESVDLDAIVSMPNSLPMRLGEQIAGRARISQVGHRFILDLSSETKQDFIAKRFTLPDHRQKSYCLLCAKCEKWRKLKVRESGPKLTSFRKSAPAGPLPISKSTWWAGVKDGRYPATVKLGRRITAWKVEDILALMERGV